MFMILDYKQDIQQQHIKVKCESKYSYKKYYKSNNTQNLTSFCTIRVMLCYLIATYH